MGSSASMCSGRSATAEISPANLANKPAGSEPAEGSLLWMQKQDPNVKGLGYRPVWSTSKITPGPNSADIKVRAGQRVHPSDDSNNYLYSSEDHPLESDAVNTFAVVEQVLAMYRWAVRRINVKTEPNWQWGKTAIKVYPRVDERTNAFYSRDLQALLFFHFKDQESDDPIYTCQSFDIVAHETGHAILDGLKPEYILSSNAQTGALHESFGDITAILALLAQLNMCETIVGLSKGQLRAENFLQKWEAVYGDGTGSKLGLRNANNNKHIDDVTEEAHDLSCVFTGAFFDILVGVFEATRDVGRYNPAETLYRVAQYMCDVITFAFIKAPDKDATFSDLKKAMLTAESKGIGKEILGKKASFSDIFKKAFEERKIGDADVKAKPATDEKFMGICGTLVLDDEEVQKLRDKLQALEPEGDDKSVEEEEEEEKEEKEEPEAEKDEKEEDKKEADQEKENEDNEEKEEEEEKEEKKEKEEEPLLNDEDAKVNV